MEIFEYIKNKNSVNGINLTDLINLIEHNDTSLYDIALVGKGKIVLKSKQDNDFKQLSCFCNYFDFGTTTNCIDLQKELGCSGNCKNCYKCILKKAEEGEVSLK